MQVTPAALGHLAAQLVLTMVALLTVELVGHLLMLTLVRVATAAQLVLTMVALLMVDMVDHLLMLILVQVVMEIMILPMVGFTTWAA
jgi:hypothetical protein